MNNPEKKALKGADNFKVDSLEFKEFPVNNWEKFRVFFSNSIIDSVYSHAESNKAVEVGGLLLGDVYRDSVGPYAFVKQIVAAKETIAGKSQITFTHDTWVKFHEEIESNFPDLKIIGWYHSHPGFGIFLSEMDLFIHENFFSNPWQIALVVDPITSDSGVFIWKDGEIVQSQRYFNENCEVKPPSGLSFPEIFAIITTNEEKLLNRNEQLERKFSLHSKMMYFLLLTSIITNAAFLLTGNSF